MTASLPMNEAEAAINTFIRVCEAERAVARARSMAAYERQMARAMGTPETGRLPHAEQLEAVAERLTRLLQPQMAHS